MAVYCSDEKKQVVQQSATEQKEGTNQTSENITAKETTEFCEDERFAYASTSKNLVTAVLLKQNPIAVLEEIRTFTNEDIVNYSPITEDFVDKG